MPLHPAHYQPDEQTESDPADTDENKTQTGLA